MAAGWPAVRGVPRAQFLFHHKGLQGRAAPPHTGLCPEVSCPLGWTGTPPGALLWPLSCETPPPPPGQTSPKDGDAEELGWTADQGGGGPVCARRQGDRCWARCRAPGAHPGQPHLPAPTSTLDGGGWASPPGVGDPRLRLTPAVSWSLVRPRCLFPGPRPPDTDQDSMGGAQAFPRQLTRGWEREDNRETHAPHGGLAGLSLQSPTQHGLPPAPMLACPLEHSAPWAGASERPGVPGTGGPPGLCMQGCSPGTGPTLRMARLCEQRSRFPAPEPLCPEEGAGAALGGQREHSTGSHSLAPHPLPSAGPRPGPCQNAGGAVVGSCPASWASVVQDPLQLGLSLAEVTAQLNDWQVPSPPKEKRLSPP